LTTRFPLIAQIGLTSDCNMSCTHCYADHRNKRDELTFKEHIALLYELESLGVCKIVYSHGENLLSPYFFQYANVVSKLKLHQTLMTNGLIVNNTFVADKIKSAGINKVMVSFETSSRTAYVSNIDNKSRNIAALDAIVLLQKAKIPKVGLSVVVLSESLSELLNLVDTAVQIKVDSINFITKRNNRDCKTKIHDEGIIGNLSEIVQKKIPKLNITSHDPLIFKYVYVNKYNIEQFECNRCIAGKYVLSIDPTGDVRPCNFYDNIIGNIKSEKLTNLWLKLGNVTEINNECCACSKLEQCAGGCCVYKLNGIDTRCNGAVA